MYHNRQHKIHSDWSGRFACVVLKTIGAPVFSKTPAYLINLSISTSAVPLLWKPVRIYSESV